MVEDGRCFLTRLATGAQEAGFVVPAFADGEVLAAVGWPRRKRVLVDSIAEFGWEVQEGTRFAVAWCHCDVFVVWEEVSNSNGQKESHLLTFGGRSEAMRESLVCVLMKRDARERE